MEGWSEGWMTDGEVHKKNVACFLSNPPSFILTTTTTTTTTTVQANCGGGDPNSQQGAAMHTCLSLLVADSVAQQHAE